MTELLGETAVMLLRPARYARHMPCRCTEASSDVLIRPDVYVLIRPDGYVA